MNEDSPKRPRHAVTPPIARGPALDILMDTLHAQDMQRRGNAALRMGPPDKGGAHAKARGTKAEKRERLAARRRKEKRAKRRHRKLNKRGKRR